MATDLYRVNLTARVEYAMLQSEAAARIEHPVLKGIAREILVRELLEPVLPAGFQCVTGSIADWTGRQSGQIDVAVIDPRLIAPVMMDRQLAIVPLECCLCVMEVKSELRAADIRQVVEMGRAVRALSFPRYPVFAGGPSVVAAGNREQGVCFSHFEPPPPPILIAVFGFKSDLSGDSKTEFDRYCETDTEAFSNPAVDMICVPGRGFWRTDGASQGRVGWAESPPSTNHDEVIDFLGVLANTVPEMGRHRAAPKLGMYIIEPRDYFRLEAGGRRTRVAGRP